MNLRRNFFVLLAANISLGGLGFACSSSSSGGTNAAGGDSGAGGDGGGTGDGGSSTGNGTSAIVLTQSAQGSTFSGGVSAFFNQRYADGETCKTSTSGPCQIVDCNGISDDAGFPIGDNAGTITVTGGKAGTQTLTFSDGAYGGANVTTQLFAPGDIFNVSAAGGTVAAFSGASAPAPGAITITTPAPTGTSSLGGPIYPVSLTSALTFAWSGGTAGAKTYFTVINSDSGVIMTCTFDSAAGTGTIPADVVAQFPSGTAAAPNSLISATTSSTTVGSGVQVNVQSNTGSAWFSTQ